MGYSWILLSVWISLDSYVNKGTRVTQCVSENKTWVHHVLDIPLGLSPQYYFVGLLFPAFPARWVSAGLVMSERNQRRHPWGAWDLWAGVTVVREKQLLLPVSAAGTWTEPFRDSTQNPSGTAISSAQFPEPGVQLWDLSRCHLSFCSQAIVQALLPFPSALSGHGGTQLQLTGKWHLPQGQPEMGCSCCPEKEKMTLQHLFLMKWKFLFMQNAGCCSQNKRNLCEAVSKGKDLSKEAQYERNCNFSCHWYSLLNWW